MRGNSHARCGVGENSEITSKNYLSLYVLPSDLVTYGEEAKNLLEDLQSRNERMFLAGYERVEFEMLNLEESMDKQQMALHSYDVVISVNALHKIGRAHV